MVPVTGLEPAHTEILDPKSSVSANSTTRAYMVPEEGLEPSRLLGGF